MVNDLVAEMLTRHGWPMTGMQAHNEFLGYALPDMMPVVRQKIPHIPDDFPDQLQDAITALMKTSTIPVDGALHTVKTFHSKGIPIAVCSNSGREELHVKMQCLGLYELFEGRVYSYEDVERPKPHPDMYLEGARAALSSRGHETGPEQIARCIVVEDSLAGVRAGIAAGCWVVGLAGNSARSALTEAGAHSVIDHMEQLLPLFL